MEWYEEYISNTRQIKVLSVPPMAEHVDAGNFYLKLYDNFTQIRALLNVNKDILSREVLPYIKKEKEIDEAREAQFDKLIELLFDESVIMSIDTFICVKVQELLADYDRKKGDWHELFESLSNLNGFYNMLGSIVYISGEEVIAKGREYFKKGFDTCTYCADFTDRENWNDLTDDEKIKALQNKNYLTTFFNADAIDKNETEKMLKYIYEARNILEDGFHTGSWPKDYPMDFYRMVTYFREINLFQTRNFPDMSRKELADYYKDIKWYIDYCLPKKSADRYEDSLEMQLVMIKPIMYFLNILSFDKALKQMEKHMFWSIKDYRGSGVKSEERLSGKTTAVIEIFSEIMNFIKTAGRTEEYAENISLLYKKLLGYVAAVRLESDQIDILYAGFASIIGNYAETPEGENFADFIIHFYALVHPPTYVHSKMVAEMTKTIADTVIDANPEIFTGILGCGNSEDVKARKNEILEFAYRCGLYHDVGKSLYLIVISIYYRGILDEEFDILKYHTKAGFDLMNKYESSKAYAETALMHHMWYDGSKGYPECAKRNLSFKPITDIVSVADSIDAATDIVGRSYAKGKTIDEMSAELSSMSGTRYAPFAVEAVNANKTKKQLEYLLDTGRKNYYFSVYDIKVKKQGK